MALYKFELKNTQGAGFTVGSFDNINSGSIGEQFNQKCEELGLFNVNFGVEEGVRVLTINDKKFKNFQTYAGCDNMIYLCDSYNYEFCLVLQSGRYIYWRHSDDHNYTGGDQIGQWPVCYNGGRAYYGDFMEAASIHSSESASQKIAYLDENFQPKVAGGINSTVGFSGRHQFHPFINYFNSGGGLVNAFKDNEKIYLSKLFITDEEYYNIIKPKHLYISKNLVDAGQKTIVSSKGREFINVGNIFYMENNPIILNKTTWIPKEGD